MCWPSSSSIITKSGRTRAWATAGLCRPNMTRRRKVGYTANSGWAAYSKATTARPPRARTDYVGLPEHRRNGLHDQAGGASPDPALENRHHVVDRAGKTDP